MYMVNALGYFSTPNPNAKGAQQNQLSEQQGMIIGGLMKRLLNQIPARRPQDKERTTEF
jgi:hypothetical protein